ncbi:DUF998 domain-containing protein [Methanosarcina mazei]|nr:DUF998 domain-containing protein [Methanosarcina mazei]
MRHLNTKKMPLTSLGSFLAILIFFISIITSSTLYNDSYSPFDNWISDLGSSSKNPTGYIYFNFGCILTGISIILSAIGLVRWKTTDHKKNNHIYLSQCCGVLMALALIMIGIFSEDYGVIHRFWATIFFILLLIFVTVTNIALKNHISYMRWIWYYAFISIAIDLIFMFTFSLGVRLPILEWLAVFSGLIWLGLIGYNTLKLEKPQYQ